MRVQMVQGMQRGDLHHDFGGGMRLLYTHARRSLELHDNGSTVLQLRDVPLNPFPFRFAMRVFEREVELYIRVREGYPQHRLDKVQTYIDRIINLRTLQ